MKLQNKNIEVEIDNKAQVSSIKFENKELLYQGDEGWGKRFPIIFPSLGFSKGFEYKGKKYEMPKHGWWKELAWESFYENDELLSVTTLTDKDKFPFFVDITQKIVLDNDSLCIHYEITNLEKTSAFFQFGIHPAFKIDGNSFLKTQDIFEEINNEGKITEKEVMLNGMPLKNIPFGKKFDTLITRNSKTKKISLVNQEETLSFTFDSKNLQVWKPSDDNFICIEPWYGFNDNFYDAPANIEEKKEINELPGHKTWIATFEIELKKNKKNTN